MPRHRHRHRHALGRRAGCVADERPTSEVPDLWHVVRINRLSTCRNAFGMDDVCTERSIRFLVPAQLTGIVKCKGYI